MSRPKVCVDILPWLGCSACRFTARMWSEKKSQNAVSAALKLTDLVDRPQYVPHLKFLRVAESQGYSAY